MIDLQTERPTPEPISLVVKNGPKILVGSSMPQPRSSTESGFGAVQSRSFGHADIGDNALCRGGKTAFKKSLSEANTAAR